MARERVTVWDNYKGLLIFLVVLGHVALSFAAYMGVRTLVDVIYLFHMPAFVFASGFFVQNMSDKKKTLLRLCLAYLIFNFALMLFSVTLLDGKFTILTPYYSLWYVLALIVWRLVPMRVLRHPLTLVLSLLAALAVGFFQEMDNTLALSRIVGFFPFYVAGGRFSLVFERFEAEKKKFHIVMGSGLLVSAIFLSLIVSFRGILWSDLLFMPYASPDRIFYRMMMIGLAFAYIFALLLILPRRPLPFFATWGKNSLSIYLLHRFIPLLLPLWLQPATFGWFFYLLLVAISFMLTWLLGLYPVAGFVENRLLSVEKKAHPQKAGAMLLLFLVGTVSLSLLFSSMRPERQDSVSPISDEVIRPDIIHAVLTDEQMVDLDNAVSIAFVGDLILLEDQVREAWSEEQQAYDFTDVFERAKPYFQQADYTIGVFEGPMAGPDAGYSTSNYADGVDLYLNFPDAFAKAVKDANIDLLTLANNHLLDKGEKGAMRTLDILDDVGLDHVGAYRNKEERQAVNMIYINDLSIAVLAYTFPSNYYDEAYFFEINPSITGILVDQDSPYFLMAQREVERDFERAKNMNPDMILVLPHMGTQFIHTPDDFQRLWCDFFLSLGADMILTDHSHAVQPIEFHTIEKEGDKKTVIVVHSPGNFVNSYIDHNGDATAIVNIFIDPEKKIVLGAGIVPMWTHAPLDGVHRALPIYDALNDSQEKAHLSRHELTRIKEVQLLVTDVMLGVPLTLDQAQEMYYFFPDGYVRQPVDSLALTAKDKQKPLYEAMLLAEHICFVGDSVTHGTKNGGYPWYEPLVRAMPPRKVSQVAAGGATSHVMLTWRDEIVDKRADLYVIAIGTNDIRYRRDDMCAMTPEDYIKALDTLVDAILDKSPEAEVVFICPWPALSHDPTRVYLDIASRDRLMDDYKAALRLYCEENAHMYIDPTDAILDVLNHAVRAVYMLDHIHPNASEGIRLYSRAVLDASIASD